MITSPMIVRRTARILRLSTKSIDVTGYHFVKGDGIRPIHSATPSVQELLSDLRELDTSALCDAEKTIASNDGNGNGTAVRAIRLMNDTIRPMNYLFHRRESVMAGVARTVSFTEANDFLPLMRSLALEAEKDEVLIVNTKSSTRAVAGEIFVNEARRKGLAGMVIDGPIRDTAYIQKIDDVEASETKVSNVMRLYATGTTPYSGKIQSPGEMQAPVVTCGGINVRPGDIVVGDQDGIVVGDFETFLELVPVAKEIKHTESQLIDGITSSPSSSASRTLASMTNIDDHVRLRLKGKSSSLEFRL